MAGCIGNSKVDRFTIDSCELIVEKSDAFGVEQTDLAGMVREKERTLAFLRQRQDAADLTVIASGVKGHDAGSGKTVAGCAVLNGQLREFPQPSVVNASEF